MIQSTADYSATLPYSLWTAEQVKHYEPILAEQAQVSLYDLMVKAGTSGFSLLRQHWPKAKRILILAGGGNNGGDALVIARLAIEANLHVSLYMHGTIEKLPDEARQAWQALSSSQCTHIDSLTTCEPSFDVVVDGLLGAGLQGQIRDKALQVIHTINDWGLPVLSLDVPSGLSANTGRALGGAIHAAVTLTFIGLKQGLMTGQACEFCGQVYYSPLGLEHHLAQLEGGNIYRLDYAQLTHLLPPRQRGAHKGHFGRAVLLGGDRGTPGAIRLAAEGCQRVGAGLVEVLTHDTHLPIILNGRPELMAHGVAVEQQALVKARLQASSVAILGPGLGQSNWSKWLFAQAINCDCPLVVDADGLNLLAQSPQVRSQWILTPHPGEAARLLNCSVAEVEQDRFAAVLAIAERYQAITLLKGAGSLVAAPNGQVRVLNVGNPGMASGGMGDVLSGIIGGLLAQHIPLFDALCLAVCVHGTAADVAAKQGERGMLASDLLPHIRALVNPEN